MRAIAENLSPCTRKPVTREHSRTFVLKCMFASLFSSFLSTIAQLFEPFSFFFCRAPLSFQCRVRNEATKFSRCFQAWFCSVCFQEPAVVQMAFAQLQAKIVCEVGPARWIMTQIYFWFRNSWGTPFRICTRTQKQQQWQIALFISFTLHYNDNVGSSACWKSISLTSPKMNLITADVAAQVAWVDYWILWNQGLLYSTAR